MAELARGAVADRPWGQTLGALGLRGLSGQVTLVADGKRYRVAFRGGAVIGALSPLASDAAVRIALTGHLVSSTQVADIARHQAAAPARDEVDVIAEQARLTPEQALRLRRRVVAQRAARTFSVERGDFVVEDSIGIPIIAGTELDVRAVIYLGARQNVSEERLAQELAQLGARFRLREDAVEDLAQFGFGEGERAVLERLLIGANLAELDDSAPGVEPRLVRAVVYALVSCNACDVDAAIRSVPRAPTAPPVRTPVPTAPPVRPTPVPTRMTPSPVTTAPPRATTSRPTSEPPRRPATPLPAVDLDEDDEVLTLRPGVPLAPTAVRPAPTLAPTPIAAIPTQTPAAPIPATPAPRPTRVTDSLNTPTIPSQRRPRNEPSQAVQNEVRSLIAARSRQLNQHADHFALLGVSQTATSDEVRKAYFALARQLHPDKLAALGIVDEARDAHRLFAQINTAFAVLNDPARRAEYMSILQRGGEAAIRAEQSRAEELARKALDAEEAYRRGEMALRRDQLTTAIGEFKRAVDLDPETADYQGMLAWAQFCASPDKMSAAQPTRAALERAIKLAPGAVSSRVLLGRVERMLGRDQDAQRHFQAVLQIAPGHADAMSELRVIEARLAQPDKSGGIFGRPKR